MIVSWELLFKICYPIYYPPNKWLIHHFKLTYSTFLLLPLVLKIMWHFNVKWYINHPLENKRFQLCDCKGTTHAIIGAKMWFAENKLMLSCDHNSSHHAHGAFLTRYFFSFLIQSLLEGNFAYGFNLFWVKILRSMEIITWRRRLGRLNNTSINKSSTIYSSKLYVEISMKNLKLIEDSIEEI